MKIHFEPATPHARGLDARNGHPWRLSGRAFAYTLLLSWRIQCLGTVHVTFDNAMRAYAKGDVLTYFNELL